MAVTDFSGSGVFEFRQYALRPGARADLLRVFESELIEPQEAAGMSIGGLYADRDNLDRFVWMRGFEDMEARRVALEAFYGGPVWAEHAATANATMLDSDDVLLLRPTFPAHLPTAPAAGRAAAGGQVTSPEWVVATTWFHEPDYDLTQWLTTSVHSLLENALGVPVATWQTESATNTFPRLPVRLDQAFVWLTSYADEDSYQAAEARLRADPRWKSEVAARIAQAVRSKQVLRLQPTQRSQHPSAMTVR